MSRRLARTRWCVVGALAACVIAPSANAQASADGKRLLDGFETTAGWKALPSDGVSLVIGSDSGTHGRAMRLDFDFHGHAGYAIVRKVFSIALPDNYAFSFHVRGNAPRENLEFKLIDSTGDNVWWNNAVNTRFVPEGRTVRLNKRHIAFAWGPIGGGELKRVAAIEFAITAGSGGKGTVWLDDLTLTPLEPVHPYTGVPVVSAATTATEQSFSLDFGTTREFGGAVVDWAPGAASSHYIVETSIDGVQWDSVYTVDRGNGGRDWIYLPESESRFLRLRMPKANSSRAYVIRELAAIPVEWSATRNDFFAHVAAAAPAGTYPKYLSGKQSYWTVVGVDGDNAEALINEQGAIEAHAGEFSLEPFFRLNGQLITWSDARQEQSLEKGYLPVPSVTWSSAALKLQITAFAADSPKSSSLYARYRITNTGVTSVKPTMYLALRPFQVNPSWQFLATQGGDARVRRIDWDGSRLRVNDSLTVVPLTKPKAVGAATFDEGDIVESLRSGTVPGRHVVRDPMEHAAAAMAYPLSIAPGESRDVYVLIPFHSSGARSQPFERSADAKRFVERKLAAAIHSWTASLNRVRIELPPSAARITNTLRAQLAYILVNNHGAQIHPGARSYARSWIRDGSMIGAALLRLDHPEQVKAFLDWYAPYQFPNGKVPCCVDGRGADPVPENDSHGELIYAIADYFRYTGDTVFLVKMWPRVAGAVAYMDSLRAQRLTAAYERNDTRVYRGLFPQSISHEGYSAKPMHSYWDDLFGLRGYVDATFIATVLQHASQAKAFADSRDTFRRDIIASYRLSMVQHQIDFLPGAAELGDFDPTSTTVAITPVGELASLPDTAVRRTFDRYWENSVQRQNGTAPWDAYTPYELRTVGTFVRLGEKQRALAILDFFFEGQRPAPWRQWAEVVWHDRDTPKFIGDMPHSWVGSDYIRSVLDMFAYDRASDSALVVGAGIAEQWVREAPGVLVRALGTPYGTLDLDIRATGDRLTARIGGALRVPPGGIAFRSPIDRPIVRALVDGRPVALSPNGEVVIRHLPATIILTY